MSLILEALKKSEQQRRLGEAPTIGTPMIVSRRQRNLMPLFIVLIVVALGIGWWLLRSPAVPPTRPTTASATPARTSATPPAAPLRAAAPKRSAQPTPQRKPAESMASTAAPILIAPGGGDRPGSVAQLSPAPLRVPGPRNVPARELPKAAVPNQPPTSPGIQQKSPQPQAGTPAATAPAAQPAAAQNSASARRASAPALPSIWELPYATRKDIPALAMTMHVYADAPKARFVVIDGERRVEGDEIADGLILREILVDGMVLEYKGTRFIYPRDGR